MEEKKSLTKKFKKLPFALAITAGLIFVCFVFYFISEKEISFFPLKLFQKNGTKEQPTGLPKTPTGRVAPSQEFFEKMEKEQGKTPSGSEFKGPSSPPPSAQGTTKAIRVKELKIAPSTCTKDCNSCPYPLNPALSWTLEIGPGDFLTAFQIQIAENKFFLNPIDSKKVISSQTQCGIPDGCKLPSPLSFNGKYWIRIRTWNGNDKESSWTNYAGTYQTPLHMYPAADFESSPKVAILGKETKFTDLSKVYGGTDGKTEIENGIKTWLWDLPEGNAQYSTLQNPSVIFGKTPGDKTVTLTITDKDGLYCDVSKNVSAIVPLPKYKEGF